MLGRLDERTWRIELLYPEGNWSTYDRSSAHMFARLFAFLSHGLSVSDTYFLFLTSKVPRAICGVSSFFSILLDFLTLEKLNANSFI